VSVRCGDKLADIPGAALDDVVPCECGCQRLWRLRERTRLLTYLPWWPRTSRAADGREVWVRLSKSESFRVLCALERA
jgi:hypothetical protein